MRTFLTLVVLASLAAAGYFLGYPLFKERQSAAAAAEREAVAREALTARYPSLRSIRLEFPDDADAITAAGMVPLTANAERASVERAVIAEQAAFVGRRAASLRHAPASDLRDTFAALGILVRDVYREDPLACVHLMDDPTTLSEPPLADVVAAQREQFVSLFADAAGQGMREAVEREPASPADRRRAEAAALDVLRSLLRAEISAGGGETSALIGSVGTAAGAPQLRDPDGTLPSVEASTASLAAMVEAGEGSPDLRAERMIEAIEDVWSDGDRSDPRFCLAALLYAEGLSKTRGDWADRVRASLLADVLAR